MGHDHGRKVDEITVSEWLGSIQLGVFGFSGDEDGDVGVGIFPERKEILIRSLGFRSVALQRRGAGETKMRERADGFVDDDSAVVEYFLEL